MRVPAFHPRNCVAGRGELAEAGGALPRQVTGGKPSHPVCDKSSPASYVFLIASEHLSV